MHSIRTRLLISHSLPLIIVILLIGLALDYVVETRVLLPGYAEELANEAKLFAVLAANQPQIWDEPQSTQDFLAHLEPILAPYVSIFNLHGNFLGSTDPFLNSENPPEIAIDEVLSQDTIIQTAYRGHLEASVVDVFVPVRNTREEIMGVIQMTYHLENIYGQLLILRQVIILVLSVGLILGAGIALLLSVNLSRSLKQVIISINQLATGQEMAWIARGYWTTCGAAARSCGRWSSWAPRARVTKESRASSKRWRVSAPSSCATSSSTWRKECA